MELQLIHSDGNFAELAQICEFESFSASISVESEKENDWELVMPSGAWSKCPVEAGHYIYIDGSQWGGPVERVSHVGSEDTVRISGTCWRGLLRRCVVAPPAGQTHYVLAETEANAAISTLLDGWQNAIFHVSPDDSSLRCSASLRYDPLLDAIDDMLTAAGGRLSVVFSGGHVLLSALPSRDMSDEVELSQEYDAKIRSVSSVRVYNHILALGRGEMLERQVVELWLLPDGTLTDDPSLVPEGTAVSTLLYDYPAVETPEELERAARRKLLSYAGEQSMEIQMTDNIGLELTDTAAVRDTLTGMTALLRVTAQELTVNSSGVSLIHHLEPQLTPQ